MDVTCTRTWHLRNGKFKKSGLMIFIQKQILLLLALLSRSGEPILARAKTSSLFAHGGFAPWTPNRVPRLHPAGGPGGSQTPPLVGASGPQCQLLFLILLLLEILTTLRKFFFIFRLLFIMRFL